MTPMMIQIRATAAAEPLLLLSMAEAVRPPMVIDQGGAQVHDPKVDREAHAP